MAECYIQNRDSKNYFHFHSGFMNNIYGKLKRATLCVYTLLSLWSSSTFSVRNIKTESERQIYQFLFKRDRNHWWKTASFKPRLEIVLKHYAERYEYSTYEIFKKRRSGYLKKHDKNKWLFKSKILIQVIWDAFLLKWFM